MAQTVLGVECTHLLYQEATFSESTFSTYSSYMLATTLRQEFPEVEAACAVYQRETGLKTKEGKTANEFVPHLRRICHT